MKQEGKPHTIIEDPAQEQLSKIANRLEQRNGAHKIWPEKIWDKVKQAIKMRVAGEQKSEEGKGEKQQQIDVTEFLQKEISDPECDKDWKRFIIQDIGLSLKQDQHSGDSNKVTLVQLLTKLSANIERQSVPGQFPKSPLKTTITPSKDSGVSYTCFQQRGIMPPIYQSSIQRESLISPLFVPSPMKGVRTPMKTRKASHCESSHGGLSELHADEKLTMQSPTPNFRINACSGSGNICGNMSQFEMYLPQYQKKQLQNSNIKKPQPLIVVPTTPSKHMTDKEHQNITPPGRVDFLRQLNLESTQTNSNKGSNLLERDPQFRGQNMIGIFQNYTDIKLHNIGPRFGLNDYPQHESILSAQTTPIKQNNRKQPVQAQYYQTDLKNTKGKRKLFQGTDANPLLPYNQLQYDESHHHNQHSYAQRLQLFSQSQQSELLSAEKRHPTMDIGIGRRRTRDSRYDSNLKNEVNNPIFHTPHNQKKQWKRLNAFQRSAQKDSVKRSIKTEMESDDDGDDPDDFDENESPVHRKKRGLKILSVKVLELVEREGQTTYKDVANDLIKQLGSGSRSGEGLSDLDDSIDDIDDDMSEDSPDKRLQTSASKKDAEGQDQKWVKNVRRRVYDALNVLYAAGVLRKSGKHVSCDPDVIEMTRSIKNELSELQDSESIHQTAEKSNSNAYELKLKAEIEDLQRQIDMQEIQNQELRKGLSENIKHLICYKHLLERNQKFEESGEITDQQQRVQLPFILMATKDSKENEIGLIYGKDYKSLAIGSKQPMTLIGDMDVLLKLNFHRVPQEWVEEQMRPYCIDRAIGSLTDQQKQSIFYSAVEGEVAH